MMLRTIYVSVLGLAMSMPVWACNQGFGPGGCVDLPEPLGPVELCILDCLPVSYVQFGNFALAKSQLSNGFEVMGWAGPCWSAELGQCPDIYHQAFEDLHTNAQRVNRAQFH